MKPEFSNAIEPAQTWWYRGFNAALTQCKDEFTRDIVAAEAAAYEQGLCDGYDRSNKWQDYAKYLQGRLANSHVRFDGIDSFKVEA
jgi:hypothetical protein